MRSFILAAVSVGALAACEPVPTNAVNAGPAGVCKPLGELAGNIMQIRQRGVPRSSLEGTLRGQIPSGLDDLVDGLIDTAYSVPVAPTAQGKQLVAAEFGVIAATACLEAVSG